MRLSLFAPVDDWLAPPPPAHRVAWIGAPGFAHRGLHGAGAAENSPAAFAAALSRGLGIECDIQRSADGHAMVFHDWELDRLTGESGPVAARGAQALARLRLGAGPDTIPRLSDLLGQVAGRVPLLIEIKSRRGVPVSPVCGAVARDLAGYRGAHAVMSFDPRVPRWFARQAPGTLRGLVVSEQGMRGPVGALRRRLALWQARPQFLAYDVRDLPSRFAEAQRRRGLRLATWTVRSPELAARAARHADAAIAEGAGLA